VEVAAAARAIVRAASDSRPQAAAAARGVPLEPPADLGDRDLRLDLVRAAGAESPDAADLGYATELWVRADAGWFVAIARHGYLRNGGAVFYPLYPLGVGLLGRVFGGYYVTAGIVFSLACCAGAFFLLYKLALPRLGADGARRALLYLALFPMSLFLQAVYSESLYLVCCLGAFVLAERRNCLGTAAATGLAMLTAWPA
jgi:Gpi18-like mannosyltransferase